MRARLALATYLHVQPQNLLLLPNVTYAVNTVVASLDLPRGSEILTTDHEYGAMIFCWRRWAQARGWKIREVKLPYQTEDAAELVAAFRGAITNRTRAIFFSHIASTTGLVLPAAEICALARRRGIITVVDGAHAAGMIPLRVEKLGADFYGANCHKWMMTPLGCGFLYARPEHHGLLLPLVTSWGWLAQTRALNADSTRGGTWWQYEHEFQGCVDRCPQMVLPEALEFRKRLGGDVALLARSRILAEKARQELSACGLRVATPHNVRLRGALTAFEISDPQKLREWLWKKHRIEIAMTRAAGKDFLRVSTAWFNQSQEIERLAGALKKRGPRE
jgi:isopenicillin-N epimerase